MRTLKTAAKFGIITASLFFAACSKSDDGGGSSGGPASGSYIHAKVAGASFKTEVSGIETAVCTKVGTGSSNIITISGGNSAANAMDIDLYGITATGTYTVDNTTDSSVLAYLETATSKSYDTSDCPSATGTVHVTFIDDTKIEGTFSFTGKVDEDCSDSKTVTEGSFRGVYQN